MGVRWPYSCCFMGSWLQDLFRTARSIFVHLPSSFFSIRLVSIHAMHPYSSTDTTAAWKKCVLFYLTSIMTDSLLINVHAFAGRVLMLFSVDQTVVPRRMNLSSSFRKPQSCVEMSPLWLTHMYSVFFSTFIGSPMPTSCSFQSILQGFGLSGCICQKRSVICVVRVRNSMFGVSSVSCLCQSKVIFFY